MPALITDLAGVAEVARGLTIAGVTAFVVIGAVFVLGFVLLFRRRGDRRVVRATDNDLPALSVRAGSALLRADDLLRGADDEFGFAIAQFGPDRARPYADAIGDARAKVAEAFRLQQALNDSIPDTDRQKREWTLQIIALSEQAQQTLGTQQASFTSLRGDEADAAATLAAVRADAVAAAHRVAAARDTLTELQRSYSPTAVKAVAGNAEAATELIAEATRIIDSTAGGISQTGVNAVTGDLRSAAQSLHRAERLIDRVEETARQLASADAALAELRERTRRDLAEARLEREQAPDPATREGIIRAMAAVEASLTGAPALANPVVELDRIGEAIAPLDLALASARNQADRLSHARAAYEGTLVSAVSQIAAAKEVVRSGDVTARTRLAEAERQLMIAQAATDPVEALDAVRSAVRHAQDADALARYRG